MHIPEVWFCPQNRIEYVALVSLHGHHLSTYSRNEQEGSVEMHILTGLCSMRMDNGHCVHLQLEVTRTDTSDVRFPITTTNTTSYLWT